MVDSPPGVFFRWQLHATRGVITMAIIMDKSVLQKVNQRLSRLGGAQSKITATVRGGDVTLAGTLQYEMQRASIVKTATSVAGVRRVIDQLKVKPREKRVG